MKRALCPAPNGSGIWIRAGLDRRPSFAQSSRVVPIHLPSTPSPSEDPARRTFLRQVILTAGAVTLAPELVNAATGPSTETERWAFLSDIHIAADPSTVSRQGVNMAAHLQRVVAEVVAEREGLDGVIINGDCAYLEGLRGDYDQLATLLAPLREAGLPIHMTMGNHDDRGPFLEAFAQARPAVPPVDGKQVSVVSGRCVNWVFLDSLRFVNKVEGEIGAAQLAWLERYLATQTAKPVILVGHHYPENFRDDIIPAEEKIQIAGLIDGEAFLGLAERFPQVKIYIYGHSHDWKVAPRLGGVHQVNLPPTAYVFNPSRPNGWVRATADAQGITVELRALDPTHPEHGKPVRLAWR